MNLHLSLHVRLKHLFIHRMLDVAGIVEVRQAGHHGSHEAGIGLSIARSTVHMKEIVFAGMVPSAGAAISRISRVVIVKITTTRGLTKIGSTSTSADAAAASTYTTTA